MVVSERTMGQDGGQWTGMCWERSGMVRWCGHAFGSILVALLAVSGCRFDPVASIPRAYCGNGVADRDPEQCDGADLSGETCQSLGLGEGTLQCRSDCTFDTTGCVPLTCGDGVLDSGEECDGADMGGMDCAGLGFQGGQLVCGDNCKFDTSGCGQSLCGNGALDDGEECDGLNLNLQTCQTLGLGEGVLHCTAECHFDYRGCEGRCGDGVAQPVLGEECDGTDLAGHDCSEIGLAPGPPDCSDSCRLDFSACATREIGEPCDRDAQCSSGFCLAEGGYHFPHGACSQDCSSNHDLCPSGSHCAQVRSLGWFCLAACVSEGCSRDGYSCFGPLSPGLTGPVCYPCCRRDDQCQLGNCKEWTGFCGVGVSGGDVGAPCAADTDCKGLLCLADGRNGYCSAPCDLHQGCPGDADCVNWLDGSATDLGVCFDACGSNEDCRQGDGYWCGSAHGTSDVCVWQ